LAHRLPASGFTNFADAGGLLGYGSNRALVYARAADFVDKILKGANPGDLPIERASRFELIVNLRTARVLDVRIPPTLLQRADRVIE
jgi:putative ABC transport system substrate-binding protein